MRQASGSSAGAAREKTRSPAGATNRVLLTPRPRSYSTRYTPPGRAASSSKTRTVKLDAPAPLPTRYDQEAPAASGNQAHGATSTLSSPANDRSGKKGRAAATVGGELSRAARISPASSVRRRTRLSGAGWVRKRRGVSLLSSATRLITSMASAA